MRSSRLCTLLIISLAANAGADTFASGSLIIPMETTYQDLGMFRAYGLVYSLLRQGVPVRWVLQPGKAFQGVDFIASAVDHQNSSLVITNHGYRAGPWVIDSANAAAALPIIDAWQTANPNVKVHVATAAFTGVVARYLVAAPRIAMHADGNQAIARGYLQAAGIPDSTLDTTWPNTSPDMLTPLQVAGPTSTNHRDGALFDANGNPTYCQFMSMHYNVTDAQALPEGVAEVREYLRFPVHFFAECQAVNAFENLSPYGFFLTTTGFAIKARPTLVDNYNFDSTFAQYDGTFGTIGGSEPAYSLPDGGAYKAGGVTMLTAQGFAPGTWDLWMTGYLDGACPPGSESCGTLGKVSYLGGHQYSTSLPISSNPTSQGVRLFLNSIFDSLCASASGQPVITITKTGPATTSSATVTFSITYGNSGSSVASAGVLTDVLPAGMTFVSATNGGTFSAGKVTWNVGSVGINQLFTVSVTVTLGASGSYANTARLDYRVGLNPFSGTSNTATVLYGPDTDGDGVLDSLDICPANPNPAQNLATDILSCGTCGVVCAAAQGVPGCSSGACIVASCNAGRSNCDGLYANGCEYLNTGFATDLANCGGCGLACAPAQATGVCTASACAIQSCNPGFVDADRNPANGCESAVDAGTTGGGTGAAGGGTGATGGGTGTTGGGTGGGIGGTGGGIGATGGGTGAAGGGTGATGGGTGTTGGGTGATGGGTGATGGGTGATGGGTGSTGGGTGSTGGGTGSTGGGTGAGNAGTEADAGGGGDGQTVVTRGCGCSSGEGASIIAAALLGLLKRRRSAGGSSRRA